MGTSGKRWPDGERHPSSPGAGAGRKKAGSTTCGSERGYSPLDRRLFRHEGQDVRRRECRAEFHVVFHVAVGREIGDEERAGKYAEAGNNDLSVKNSRLDDMNHERRRRRQRNARTRAGEGAVNDAWAGSFLRARWNGRPHWQTD